MPSRSPMYHPIVSGLQRLTCSEPSGYRPRARSLNYAVVVRKRLKFDANISSTRTLRPAACRPLVHKHHRQVAPAPYAHATAAHFLSQCNGYRLFSRQAPAEPRPLLRTEPAVPPPESNSFGSVGATNAPSKPRSKRTDNTSCPLLSVEAPARHRLLMSTSVRRYAYSDSCSRRQCPHDKYGACPPSKPPRTPTQATQERSSTSGAPIMLFSGRTIACALSWL